MWEVFVLGHDHRVMRKRVIPEVAVAGIGRPDVDDMFGEVAAFVEEMCKCGWQLRVDEEPHAKLGGDEDGVVGLRGCIRQASTDVVTDEVGVILKDFCLIGASGE